MKKIYFVAVVLFISKIVLSSSQESSTSLVVAVHKYLNQFNVARKYNESKEEFLARIRASKEFEHVAYAEYPEKLFQKGSNPKEGDEKKRYLLGLFIPNIYAVKSCGFWGKSEDGFYVGVRTKIVGKSFVRFQERGHYEWVIELPNELSGNEFENTPIQPLLNYLLAQNESEFVIPLNVTTGVSFTKKEKEIIARLKYK